MRGDVGCRHEVGLRECLHVGCELSFSHRVRGNLRLGSRRRLGMREGLGDCDAGRGRLSDRIRGVEGIRVSDEVGLRQGLHEGGDGGLGHRVGGNVGRCHKVCLREGFDVGRKLRLGNRVGTGVGVRLGVGLGVRLRFGEPLGLDDGRDDYGRRDSSLGLGVRLDGSHCRHNGGWRLGCCDGRDKHAGSRTAAGNKGVSRLGNSDGAWVGDISDTNA